MLPGWFFAALQTSRKCRCEKNKMRKQDFSALDPLGKALITTIRNTTNRLSTQMAA